MNFNPFSVITSKIFGGLLLAGIAFFVVDEIGDHRAEKTLQESITAKEAKITRLETNLATARGNVSELKFGLGQCNAGVARMAVQTAAVAEAGRKAVADVRKAGEKALAATVRRVQAMPIDGRTAAEQCAQADAILQEGAK